MKTKSKLSVGGSRYLQCRLARGVIVRLLGVSRMLLHETLPGLHVLPIAIQSAAKVAFEFS